MDKFPRIGKLGFKWLFISLLKTCVHSFSSPPALETAPLVDVELDVGGSASVAPGWSDVTAIVKVEKTTD